MAVAIIDFVGLDLSGSTFVRVVELCDIPTELAVDFFRLDFDHGKAWFIFRIAAVVMLFAIFMVMSRLRAGDVVNSECKRSKLIIASQFDCLEADIRAGTFRAAIMSRRGFISLS